MPITQYRISYFKCSILFIKFESLRQNLTQRYCKQNNCNSNLVINNFTKDSQNLLGLEIAISYRCTTNPRVTGANHLLSFSSKFIAEFGFSLVAKS